MVQNARGLASPIQLFHSFLPEKKQISSCNAHGLARMTEEIVRDGGLLQCREAERP